MARWLMMALALTAAGQAVAQSTLNRRNAACMIRVAKDCFDEQDGRPDSERGGRSVSDYCSDRAVEECGG